ncbi:MAG TPA: hypothetical protein VGM31_14535 [Puia sp.]|jgi:hypothetical protein
MGACSFTRTSIAENANIAFKMAHKEAELELGHRGGYSGDINSKHDFTIVTAPQGVDLSTWLSALHQDNLPESLNMHIGEFERQYEAYTDKDEPVLCFEVPGKTKESPVKEYIFIGTARE